MFIIIDLFAVEDYVMHDVKIEERRISYLPSKGRFFGICEILIV
jgi:hypothetical protein